MEAEATGKIKQVFDRKVTKIAIIGFIVILILGALFLTNILKFRTTAKNTVAQQTATVRKGDISVTVTGSGSMMSSNREDISSHVTSTINKIHIKEGDKVKTGDLLFEFDDSDALLNIEKAKNNISQTQLTQNTNIDSLNNLNITAPFSGQVTGIQAKVGDVLSKNATVLTITDISRLKLLVPFSGIARGQITPNQIATVYLQGLMQTVDGRVTYVDSKSYSTSSGGELYNVEIEVTNPGSLKEGMKASADIVTGEGVLSSADSGTLSYVDTLALKCVAGGTVNKINVKENQHVNIGDVLIGLTNDDLAVSTETTSLKLQDLQSQLDSSQKQLSYYKIYAPIDGVITKLNVTEGTSVKTGDVLAAIADTSHMEFNIPIDELDIAKIEIGQKANVTVDALPDTSTKPLSGEVSKIAIEGTSSNGVTTYPVTIKLEGSDKLKTGMNANAEVFISQKSNVLRVPIQAVQKMGNRAMVMVKGDEKALAQYQQQQGSRQNRNGGNWGNSNGNGSGNGNANANGNRNGNGNANRNANGNSNGNGNATGNGNQNGAFTAMAGRNSQYRQYYANAIPKMVEVGISDDSYIEIISGLNEGDEVILPPVSTGQNTTNNANGNRMQFGGGGGGGFGGGGAVYRRPD